MKLKINFSNLLNRATKKALFIMLATIVLSMTAFVQRNDAQTIGQSAEGGIVFYVDVSGHHGLVAANIDQSKGIRWYNGVYKTTDAAEDGIGTGLGNTMRIVDQQYNDDKAGSFAANLCLDLVKDVNGIKYTDWYLPSKHELNLMYKNLHKADPPLGGFANDRYRYWSSTEIGNTSAWSQDFGNGYQHYDNKGLSKRVRAVRAF